MPDLPDIVTGQSRRVPVRTNENQVRRGARRMISTTAVATPDPPPTTTLNTNDFPIYWGGGPVPKPTRVEPRELVLSGSMRGTPWPIPFGTSRLIGKIAGYDTWDIAQTLYLVCAYVFADVDSRISLGSETLRFDGKTAANAGNWLLGTGTFYDGTQTTLDPDLSAHVDGWDYAAIGSAYASVVYRPQFATGLSGIPTVTLDSSTSAALDWTEQVVITAGHQNDIAVTEGYGFIGRITITIDGVGSPNTFEWFLDGVSQAAGVTCPTSATALGSTGVKIAFGANTGHGLNDSWTIRPLSNPFMAAYFYMTSARYGPNWPKTKFHQASWTASANVCDVDQGTDDPLWSVNGAVEGTTARDILQIIMRHCFGYLWIFGGQVHATLDTDKTVDATFTDLDFVEGGEPTWSRIPKRQRVNHCVAWYTDTGNKWQDASRQHRSSDITASDIREVQERLALCTSGAMAKRWATQRVAKDTLETILVKCKVHPGASSGGAIDLGPGDRMDITSATGLSATPFRVTRTMYNTDAGYVELEGRLYDGDTVSTGTSAENDPYDYQEFGPPDPPTSSTKTFVEKGDWPGESVLPKPDLLSDWTTSNLTYTGFTVPPAVDYEYSQMTASATAATVGTATLDITSLVGSDTGFWLHALLRYSPTSDQGRTWKISYLADSAVYNGQTWTIRDDGSASQEWYRLLVELDLDTGASTHELQIEAGAGTIGGLEKLLLRRVHLVPRSFKPNLILSEVWDWVEDAGAPDTVSFYQWGITNALGIFLAQKQTTVGSTHIEIPVFSNSQIIDYGSIESGTYSTGMMALGLDGTRAEFPLSTGAFVEGETFSLLVTDLPDAATIDAATLQTLAAASFLRANASSSVASGNTLGIVSGATLNVDGVADLTGVTEMSMPAGVCRSFGNGAVAVSSNAVAVTREFMTITTSANVDLNTITITPDYAKCILRGPSGGYTVTVKDAVDNIYCDGNADIVLNSPNQLLECIKYGTYVRVKLWDC